MTTQTNEPNLLVRAALEAVLAKSVSRLDAAARSERVKAAALMECAEKGYSHLTIADIAKRAKVSTATIYADYKDRDALLVAAMEMLFAILAADVIEIPDTNDPVDRVEQLLLAHGYVYMEPLTKWLFRLHINLAWSGHPHLHEIGRRVFQGIDAFWTGFLGQLVEQELLAPFDAKIVVPLLLGPVERCTIISQLGCGDDENAWPRLADVARHAAESLFEIWGADAFWAQNKRGLTLRRYADHVGGEGGANATFLLPEQPSALVRLEESLARASTRPSPAQRKTRILLAAAVECQERGYNAASMIEVAARANVSTATLYKHFADKAGLFASALERETQNQAWLHFGDKGASAPSVTLTQMIFNMAATAADPEWGWVHNIVMASEISGTPRIVANARESRAALEHRIAGHLSELVKNGVLAPLDIELTVNFLLGGVERSGVFALILFGRAGVEPQKLSTLSVAAVDVVFGLHGALRVGGVQKF